MHNLLKWAALVACTVVTGQGWAQLVGPNVLGLPALPQTQIAPPAAVSPAGKKAANPKVAAKPAQSVNPAAATNVNDANAKSVLNGGVTLASSYIDTRAIVVVTTNAPYTGDVVRKTALQAAALVQRDVRLACASVCTPMPMAKAKFLPDGKLQFEMVIEGLGRVLSDQDMINMVLGRPVGAAVVASRPGAVSATLAGSTVTTAQDISLTQVLMSTLTLPTPLTEGTEIFKLTSPVPSTADTTGTVVKTQ